MKEIKYYEEAFETQETKLECKMLDNKEILEKNYKLSYNK